MQLEKLKKADLIKLARELKQENKLLKKEVTNVKNGELSDDKLPLIAATSYKNAEGQYFVDILKYSPDENLVKLDKRIEETTSELALYKLEMVIAEQMVNQEGLNE